jgi:AcrR family transcriptional regulator
MRAVRQPAEPSDRRAERHEANRRQILDAAWALAREHGLAGWSLRDLASVVGMRAPSLYVYFDSKAALYDAMFAEGCAELLALYDTTPTDTITLDGLYRGARMFFDFCVDNPARYQLLFLRTIPGFVPTPESYALAQTALDRLIKVLHAAGVTGPDAVDLWTALFTGMASQQISNDPGGDRWRRLIDQAVDRIVAVHEVDDIRAR